MRFSLNTGRVHVFQSASFSDLGVTRCLHSIFDFFSFIRYSLLFLGLDKIYCASLNVEGCHVKDSELGRPFEDNSTVAAKGKPQARTIGKVVTISSGKHT